jgi:hypothetical protein
LLESVEEVLGMHVGVKALEHLQDAVSVAQFDALTDQNYSHEEIAWV